MSQADVSAGPSTTQPDPTPALAAPEPVTRERKPLIAGGARALPGHLFFGLVSLYALGGLIYLALKLLRGDHVWQVALFDNGASLALLPALPLLALALWRRRRIPSILLGLVTVGYVWLFGGLFLPHLDLQPACAASGTGCQPALRVMAFNLENRFSDPDQIVASIESYNPDFVALEEYSVDKQEAFAQQLGAIYPYRVQYHDSVSGVGLISKFPITNAENLVIADPTHTMSHVHAVLDVNGTPLTVYVVHAIAPGFGRSTPYVVRGSADIAELTHLATSGGPVIMLGDFNMSDISDDYHVIASSGLIDTWREAGFGFGFTWPTRSYRPRETTPLIRIDYIWHTKDFRALDIFVGDYATSDHRPLIADLAWLGQQ